MSDSKRIYPSFIIQSSVEGYLHSISKRSKRIYWLILLIIIGTSASMPFIMVDVTIRTSGLIKPSIEKQQIVLPFGGKVIYTKLRNNLRVNAGDTILVIDTIPICSKIRTLEFNLAELKSYQNDLGLLIEHNFLRQKFNPKSLITSKYMLDVSSFQRQISTQSNRIDKFKKEHSRNALLYKQKIIAEVDFETSKYNLDNEVLLRNQFISQQLTTWQASLTEISNQIPKIESEIETAYNELGKHFITATLSGTIQQSNELQVGSIIYANQTIAELSPDCELIAVCYVQPSDIGLIRVNQDVKIQVDAFNYNQWGLLPATIKEVSDDIVSDGQNNMYFIVKCELLENHLTLQSGFKGQIKKGMTISSRIIVTERTVYDLLFDKVDSWFNPYTEMQ